MPCSPFISRRYDCRPDKQRWLRCQTPFCFFRGREIAKFIDALNSYDWTADPPTRVPGSSPR